MGNAQSLEWAVAGRPLPGEEESGDRYWVGPTAAGWLLAVVDGLGHGAGAAAASRALTEVLERRAELPLRELVRECHERLRSTRGAALSVATIADASGTLCWVGIGNVEGVLVRAGAEPGHGDYITLRGGIVGYRMPAVEPSEARLGDGDLLVLATDGIREQFVEVLTRSHSPQANAERVLADFARPEDDALVLVARWRSIDARQVPTP